MKDSTPLPPHKLPPDEHDVSLAISRGERVFARYSGRSTVANSMRLRFFQIRCPECDTALVLSLAITDR